MKKDGLENLTLTIVHRTGRRASGEQVMSSAGGVVIGTTKDKRK